MSDDRTSADIVPFPAPYRVRHQQPPVSSHNDTEHRCETMSAGFESFAELTRHILDDDDGAFCALAPPSYGKLISLLTSKARQDLHSAARSRPVRRYGTGAATSLAFALALCNVNAQLAFDVGRAHITVAVTSQDPEWGPWNTASADDWSGKWNTSTALPTASTSDKA